MSALKTEILNRLSVAHLPSLPHVLIKLMSMCQSDNTTISDLSALIEQEPAMAHKIISVASSPAYRQLTPQVKLEQSLITLGTHMVRMLVINEAVYQNFNNLPIFKQHDLRTFWLHSLKTAIIARKAAWHASLFNVDEAYLCGLMHDIGRLALLSVVPDLYGDLFGLSDDDAICEKEREALGITHAEAGAWLIGEWNLESALSDSVKQHHVPDIEIGLLTPLSRLIHMSNRLSYCEPGDPRIVRIVRDYNFPPEIASRIIIDALEEVSNAATHLGIDIGPGTPESQDVEDTTASPVRHQFEKAFTDMIQVSELGRFFESHETAEALQEAAMKAASALFSPRSMMLLWETEESGTYRIHAVDKTSEKLVGHRLPLPEQSRISEAFRKKEPIFIFSEDGFSLTPEKNMAKLLGGNSWLLLPLALDDRCPGVLFAGFPAERLENLQKDKYRQIYFGRQFVAVWNRPEKHAPQEAPSA